MAGKHASGYGERETKTYTEKSKPKKKRKGLKIFGIVVLTLVIIIAGVLGGAYWYIADKFGKKVGGQRS